MFIKFGIFSDDGVYYIWGCVFCVFQVGVVLFVVQEFGYYKFDVM